jgi:hypothetical protein
VDKLREQHAEELDEHKTKLNETEDKLARASATVRST